MGVGGCIWNLHLEVGNLVDPLSLKASGPFKPQS